MGSIKLKKGVDVKQLSQMEHFVWNYGSTVDANISALKKVPWWSYRVTKGDSNYDHRQDKSVDYFELDSDHNFQIESFFQECKKGLKRNIGDRFTIVGDQNCV